jgi:hypothetical protein
MSDSYLDRKDTELLQFSGFYNNIQNFLQVQLKKPSAFKKGWLQWWKKCLFSKNVSNSKLGKRVFDDPNRNANAVRKISDCIFFGGAGTGAWIQGLYLKPLHFYCDGFVFVFYFLRKGHTDHFPRLASNHDLPDLFHLILARITDVSHRSWLIICLTSNIAGPIRRDNTED